MNKRNNDSKLKLNLKLNMIKTLTKFIYYFKSENYLIDI